MVAQTFNEALVEVVRKKIQSRVNELGVSISAGAMPSFEQYKFNCGIAQGLQHAMHMMDATHEELLRAARGENVDGKK